MQKQQMFANRTTWNTQPNPIAGAVARLRAAAEPFLDLTESNPTRCAFEFGDFDPLTGLTDARGKGYSPDPRGLHQAREAVAALFAGAEQPLSAARLYLTAGTSEAYSHCFRLLCNPGDSVLVPSPSYPLLDFLATISDVTLHAYPLYYAGERWGLDIDSLRAAIRPDTRAIVVIHPNNPTGSYLKRQEFEALIHLAAEHRLAIIADEVFADFSLTGDPDCLTGSLVGRQRDALLFTLGGVSKTLALPQMKVAWMAVDGPGELVAEACERLDVLADTLLSVGTPPQLALPGWLAWRRPLQETIRRRLRDNLATLKAAGPALTTLTVEGGWNAVLRLPRHMSDEARVLTLLEEQRVLIDPGSFYGFPAEGYFVVSLIVPPAIFAEGIARLGAVHADTARA